ncbi:MAG: serine/threonine protein kinase [Chloroflexi bacterium]|nr:serine/threonine protein kinase [Chloroflexota bacterium]
MTPEALPAPGAVIGPFTIVEALPAGNGGMARVFVATVSGAQPAERVALKIARTLRVPPEQADSDEQTFYNEALNNEVETLKRLRHPNIVRLYPIPRGLPRNPYAARAMELEGNPWFCAMEYLAGGSLQAHMKTFGLLPLAETLELAYQIGLALDHVHAKGMAHLDVKPDNILFRHPLPAPGEAPAGPPQPVLIDFGIAAKMQKAGPPAGSVSFMPPERVRIMRGEVAPEHFGDQSKVDIYSLGILLYRMLTGHLPFDGVPRRRLASAILNTQPRPPRQLNPGLPPKVEELVMSALEKIPDHRPRIEELITRLDEAMAVRPPAPTRATRPRRSLLVPITLALAVALFICSSVSLVEFGLLMGNLVAKSPVPSLAATAISTRLPAATLEQPPATTPPAATATLAPSPTLLPPTPTLTPIPPVAFNFRP